MEFPIEFFLTLAWNPSRWPKQAIADYARKWTKRDFGSEYATEIPYIISACTKLNGARKPELVEPDVFSLVHYQEAGRVLAEWQSLVSEAEQIYARLPENVRDAFYEIVLLSGKGVGACNRDQHHRQKQPAVRTAGAHQHQRSSCERSNAVRR